jgi:hypothetical protein
MSGTMPNSRFLLEKLSARRGARATRHTDNLAKEWTT